jgi:hypothetical protein
MKTQSFEKDALIPVAVSAGLLIMSIISLI